MATATNTVAPTSQATLGFDSPGNGIIGGYDGNDPVILRAITAFTAIAWYNSIETLIVVLFIFKKYKGVYFWSLEITALATIIYQVGAWGKLLKTIGPDAVGVALQNCAWIFMVTGQSVVLYSRLHLVTHNRYILRFVLCMIIFDTIVLYVPTTTLNWGSSLLRTSRWIHGYSVFEKIQMTWFSVQEITISGLYLYEIANMFKVTKEPGTRRVLIELILLNISLILLDVALLTVEYMNLYMIETTLKGMIYSIKLKLELAVLSKIVRMVKKRKNSNKWCGAQDFVLRKTLETNETDYSPTIAPSEPRKSSQVAPHEIFPSFPSKESAASSSSCGIPETIEEIDIELEKEPETIEEKIRRINSHGIPIHDNEDLKRYKERRASSKRRSIDGLYPGRLGGEDEETVLATPD